ncbi:endonuclease/exonuclease/phosphatase family metal-dependent hydrolase [Flavobacteriaceae bacterium MAR_2010_105]|nr:endonuclease/exonuclease/phosphatase family metal-dependent hydrolase [Flavobacteriaceae bacterium MAR_2010_105]
MKSFFTGTIVLIIVLLSCKSHGQMDARSQNLSVMTYNIRLDVASDGENAWPNRKEFLSSQILFYNPDILGVQEARPNQMDDLKLALETYKAIGLGRDGNGQGEYSAIFYNTKKVKVEIEETFWLSETPDKVSQGWDAAYPRICTYGLFSLIKSGKKVWIFNTHLDHVGAEAQQKGMQLILKKIEEVNTNDYPVILTGDFNVEPNSELFKNLNESLNDSKELAQLTFGPNGTFNGFKFHEPVTRRIDYIMVSKSDQIEVKKHAVLSSSIDLKYPSDHFPVLVKFNLK